MEMEIIILYWPSKNNVDIGQEPISIIFENQAKQAEYISNWPIYDEPSKLLNVEMRDKHRNIMKDILSYKIHPQIRVLKFKSDKFDEFKEIIESYDKSTSFDNQFLTKLVEFFKESESEEESEFEKECESEADWENPELLENLLGKLETVDRNNSSSSKLILELLKHYWSMSSDFNMKGLITDLKIDIICIRCCGTEDNFEKYFNDFLTKFIFGLTVEITIEYLQQYVKFMVEFMDDPNKNFKIQKSEEMQIAIKSFYNLSCIDVQRSLNGMYQQIESISSFENHLLRKLRRDVRFMIKL
jgi:hypothetical protein